MQSCRSDSRVRLCGPRTVSARPGNVDSRSQHSCSQQQQQQCSLFWSCTHGWKHRWTPGVSGLSQWLM
ncbi:hypothetical protein lerEdw1_006039 [Lerista edwardsae]|nr:hypothetical protein lerEdw1_006039 [Lerista edwardsae]